MNNFAKKRVTEIARSEEVNRFFFLDAFDWLNRHQFSRHTQGLQLAVSESSAVRVGYVWFPNPQAPCTNAALFRT